jgi:undecaprenyl-diphosphatase
VQIWEAVVLGLVEGITEYLPVSSTGHLIIAGDLLGFREGAAKAALDDFNVIVQGGAILAVVGLYFPRFLQMLAGLVGKNALGLRLWINLVIAFLPAAAIGFVLHDHIKAHLFFTGPVAGALIVGGIYMILVERWRTNAAARALAGSGGGGGGPPPTKEQINAYGKEVTDLTPIDALKIGCLQVLSMWPGTSRSMMTITGGMFVGLKPAAAAEFSFLLGAPTLLAATGYAMYKNLSHAQKTGDPTLFQTLGMGPVLVGMLVAAVSAAVAVKWLVGFLNRRGLTAFGWYRIVAGVVLLALAAGGLVTVD